MKFPEDGLLRCPYINFTANFKVSREEYKCTMESIYHYENVRTNSGKTLN